MQKNDGKIEKLPPVLTLARVAEIAGVSRRQVREWVARGRMPAMPRSAVNGKRYFETRAVLRALGVEVSE